MEHSHIYLIQFPECLFWLVSCFVLGFVCFFSFPLESKLHESWDFCLVCSLMFLQCPKHCLTQSKRSINIICQMSEKTILAAQRKINTELLTLKFLTEPWRMSNIG